MLMQKGHIIHTYIYIHVYIYIYIYIYMCVCVCVFAQMASKLAQRGLGTLVDVSLLEHVAAEECAEVDKRRRKLDR